MASCLHTATMMEIRNTDGERLDYSHHGTESSHSGDASPLVLIGHGVTANKDRPFLVLLAESLAESGLETIRFSFSGNGNSEGDFRKSCPSREVGDLRAMIDAFPGREIYYVGHSMGGAVGILALEACLPIRRFVSLAGMVHPALFVDTEFGDLTPDSPDAFMWEKQDCPLSSQFMDDMRGLGSLLPKVSSISVPWLIVHGEDDDVVPISHSREVAAANHSIRLVELSGADHVFSENGSDREMAQTVVGWLNSLE